MSSLSKVVSTRLTSPERPSFVLPQILPHYVIFAIDLAATLIVIRCERVRGGPLRSHYSCHSPVLKVKQEGRVRIYHHGLLRTQVINIKGALIHPGDTQTHSRDSQ